MKMSCDRCGLEISGGDLDELLGRIEYHVQENCHRRPALVRRKTRWQKFMAWLYQQLFGGNEL